MCFINVELIKDFHGMQSGRKFDCAYIDLQNGKISFFANNAETGNYRQAEHIIEL